MKFPSIIRTSKYSHFEYVPRYYDPVKEEIEGKIKAAQERKEKGISDATYSSHISTAFRNRERQTSKASTVQMMIGAAMLSTFVGWLFYGNEVFYAYLLLSPFYFYFRFKQQKSPTD